jgi:hypothetical protein
LRVFVPEILVVVFEIPILVPEFLVFVPESCGNSEMDASKENPGPEIHIPRGTIHDLVTKLLQRKGMFVAEAEIVAERMIETDLQRTADEGTGTLPGYLEAMDLGDIDPRARIITVSEAAALAVLDGSSGIGHVAATRAMQLAIEKSRVVGTGSVIVKNSRPCGDLGTIARLAARAGSIGLVTTSFHEETGNPASFDLAWSVPAAEGREPIVGRENRQNLGNAGLFLCGILSSGLSGSDPAGRKRKGLREANVVEYCLQALDPSLFGVSSTLLEKWRSLTPNESANPAASTDQTTIGYSAAHGKMLSGLAAKIKFPVTW